MKQVESKDSLSSARLYVMTFDAEGFDIQFHNHREGNAHTRDGVNVDYDDMRHVEPVSPARAQQIRSFLQQKFRKNNANMPCDAADLDRKFVRLKCELNNHDSVYSGSFPIIDTPSRQIHST